jgi:hypothetical protein
MVEIELTNLVAVGLTGNGKSALLNSMHGKEVFEEAANLESCTTSIATERIHGTDIVTVDTGGLWDTKQRSALFFQALTSFMSEHGGVLVVVIKADAGLRLDQRLVDLLEAICLCAGVRSLASTGVLVCTNIPVGMYILGRLPVYNTCVKHNSTPPGNPCQNVVLFAFQRIIPTGFPFCSVNYID